MFFIIEVRHSGLVFGLAETGGYTREVQKSFGKHGLAGTGVRGERNVTDEFSGIFLHTANLPD